jgi:hypothetical protein
LPKVTDFDGIWINRASFIPLCGARLQQHCSLILDRSTLHQLNRVFGVAVILSATRFKTLR